ncbi:MULTISPECIES: energy-coupling factor transporter transmembrane protein EcfT [unclassified Oceanispirochaeta]|uniref:energy-coupling factor transporter transmembrane component T family protein n=1 Tax=unclassified Oceanispirochaeta TaxID=2635722 RepID=UPI000E09AAA8|nr:MULTISPECIES: energy-coupling factor transporter transmembrane protein EcfT [unclassified Oceanispirochaeta]MBF9014889.1 energy-coupling factor transporter transmembrane protein EcfT [Oceanispirochaeta sp. M2]NPD71430.1 energy-coupling factor transporter transmembrane protein EcfT [Oceanispirochaeta sp. M1]RDG33391.1 energy-coupling factor transporter transmembrane protein EcfT [Oceanispirochaeta sp. M1]
MAETLIFQYQPGTSILHRTDIRIKLAAMITVSLLLIQVSIFRLLFLLPFLLLLHLGVRKNRSTLSLPLLILVMPTIIFAGNFLSLILTETAIVQASLTAGLRSLRFIYILWMAQLFTMSSDPMCITPAFYQVLKHIPLLPAGRISTQMGLSLTLIPIILEEMNEIRDAMASRCGWSARKPLRNLIHMGLPLLNGVLIKAEDLSDAMESRLFTEDATEPELLSTSLFLTPLLSLLLIIALLLISEHLLHPIMAAQLPFRFY